MAEREFYRDIYSEVKMSIMANIVTFLLGPRKCGKTFCLSQIEREIENSRYYNLKAMGDTEKDNLILEICESIQKDNNIIYLIDEVTYIDKPELALLAIYDAMSENGNTTTRVVFTGSQSVALKSWADKYFCGCAGYVYADFMNYDEWLRYKGGLKASEESYKQFIDEIDKFYNMTSIEEYLEGCLNETVVSNSKSMNLIFNNNCTGLTVDFLLDVLYSVLICLHNKVRYTTFINRGQFEKTLRFMLSGIKIDDNVKNNIGLLLNQRYNSFKKCDETSLKKALVFLYNCGLITFTYVGTHCEEWNIANKLLNECISLDSKTDYKGKVFDTYNIFIKHPMFYMGLIKQVISNATTKNVKGVLLGSIVECHVRGLLPQKGQYEYHGISEDNTEVEVDYVSDSLYFAVEITVSDNHGNSFQVLRDKELAKKEEERNNYSFIMLTKSLKYKKGDTEYIPYYDYIQLLSSENNPYKLCT